MFYEEEEEEIMRVSRVRVLGVIEFLKQRGVKIAVFNEIKRSLWYIEYKGSMMRFDGNRAIYDFLMPAFKQQEKEEFNEILELRRKREFAFQKRVLIEREEAKK